MKRNFVFLSFLLICCFLLGSCGEKSGTFVTKVPEVKNTPSDSSATNSTSSAYTATTIFPYTFGEGDKLRLSTSI